MKYLFTYIFIAASLISIYGQSDKCNRDNMCFIEREFEIKQLEIDKTSLIELGTYFNPQTPTIINDNNCRPIILLFKEGVFPDPDSLVSIDIDALELNTHKVTIDWAFNQQLSVIKTNEEYRVITIEQNLKKLICFNFAGDTIWVSNKPYDDSNLNLRPNPTICDINKDGISEVVVYNKVYNAENGVLLCDGGEDGKGGSVSSIVVGEFNGDNTSLELAAGNTVYELDINNLEGEIGNTMTSHVLTGTFIKDGRTSMADINHDGVLDIIVIPEYDMDAKPYLYCYTFKSDILELIADIRLPIAYVVSNNDLISRPIYGSLNDGNEGILVKINDSLRYITFDGTQNLKQKWTYFVEDSGGNITPTIFDLNGDGIKEIIVKGSEQMVFLNDNSGVPVEVYRGDCNAVTWNENPVIADIDNDGEVEVCTLCEDLDRESFGHGRLTIFSSPEDGPPWAPARGIWNQYGYHVLNINDDMTVPQYMENNATYMDGKYNNFMVQESLLGEDGMVQYPAASLYGEMDCINYDEMAGGGSIDFYIYNNEDASRSASDSVIVSFYNGDPYNGGVLLDTMEIRGGIPPGGVKAGTYILNDISGIDRIYLLVNAMSVSTGSPLVEDFIQRECDVTDNVYMMELGFDTIEEERALCGGDSYDFYGEEITTAGIYFHREEDMMGCLTTLYKLEVDVVDEITTTLSTEACESYTINNETITTSGIYEYSYKSNNGCDSIVTLDLTINNPSSITYTETHCDQYEWNGTTYTESGTYEYASFNQYGCDSIATLELEINENIEQSLMVGACDSYDWNGTSYTESGTYTYEGVTSAGCDSIVTLDLTISDVIELTESVVTCERYEIDGDILTESGSYTYGYTSVAGCDSIVTLDLTINEPSSTTAQVIECESYNWNGTTYTESGTYEYQSLNQYGCDSIATLELEINKNIEQSLTVGACDSYDWNGATYTESGMYTYEGLTNAGCDSIVTLDLTISEEIELTESVVTCERYEIDGDILTESGSYIYNYTSTTGCDSIVTLDLTIHEPSSTLVVVSECESYQWNGATYTESGTYEYQSLNQYGCDSIVTLELEINNNVLETVVEHTCEEYEWNDVVYTESGMYTYDGLTSTGCDSTVTLDLTITDVIEIEETAVACDSYDWNGATYTESGTYTYEGLTSAGCDSIVTLDLTITDVIEIEETAMACDSYQWDGETYEESGIYRVESISADGCDSVTTLELLIFPSYLMQDTVETTEPYHWVVNGATYDESGVYEERYETIYGCDSLYQLNLLIDVSQTIDFPNVFQPTENQKFTLYGKHIEEVTSFTVYDRWGNIIYDQEGPQDKAEWDGKIGSTIALPGVYVWKANVILKDGRPKVYVGDITVVR